MAPAHAPGEPRDRDYAKSSTPSAARAAGRDDEPRASAAASRRPPRDGQKLAERGLAIHTLPRRAAAADASACAGDVRHHGCSRSTSPSTRRAVDRVHEESEALGTSCRVPGGAHRRQAGHPTHTPRDPTPTATSSSTIARRMRSTRLPSGRRALRARSDSDPRCCATSRARDRESARFEWRATVRRAVTVRFVSPSTAAGRGRGYALELIDLVTHVAM